VAAGWTCEKLLHSFRSDERLVRPEHWFVSKPAINK